VVGWGLAFVLCMFTVDFTALFCILTSIQKTRLRLVVYLPRLPGEYARTRSGTGRYETNGWHGGRMTAIVMNTLPDRRNEMRRVVVGMGTGRMCESISIVIVRFAITFLGGIVFDYLLLLLIGFSPWITYLCINRLILSYLN